MNKIILVTGGARSGKSVFAESLVTGCTEKRGYIATAPVIDDEMARRVALHRQRRAAGRWRTIEEELDLPTALRQAAVDCDGVLIDCLTLWINNLIYHAGRRGEVFREEEFLRECRKLTAALREFPGLVVAVLNEVGLGLVPEDPVSRLFRDCSGRCGCEIAAMADEVYLVACGIPLAIRKGDGK